MVLADQVDNQIEKIGDLEKLLDDKKEVLRRTEDILQREMINRSALETKKLELLTDLSQLKLRQAAIEKENMELRKKLAKTMQATQMQQVGTGVGLQQSQSKQSTPLRFVKEWVENSPKTIADMAHRPDYTYGPITSIVQGHP